MRRPRRAAWLSLLLLLGPAVVAPPARAEQKAGAPAHDFTLPDLRGGQVRLSGLRGKVVVIDFWASWCEPCKRELPELEKLARDLAGRGVLVLAVNLDQKRDNASGAAQALGLSAARVLWDPEGKVAERYDPPKMPTSYVVDQGGTVRHVHDGYDGPGDIVRLRRELSDLVK